MATIAVLEHVGGLVFQGCVNESEKQQREAENRAVAVAELTRRGRPPPPDDTRTLTELWDDVKGRTAQAAALAGEGGR